jgi:tetratricopeptide (TPR) repeat protein
MDRHYIQTLVERGRYFLEECNYEKAIDFFLRALEMDTDLPDALEGLGQAYAALNDWTAAVRAFEALVNVVPEDGFASYLLGHVLGGAGEYESSLRELRRAKDLGYDTPELHAAMGYSLHMLGDIDAALSEYETALRLEPDDTTTLFNAGKLLASVGRLDDAKIMLERVTDIDPDDATAWIALGEVYEDLDSLEDAVESYKRAVEINPSDIRARCLVARACTLLGMLDEAEWEFMQVLADEPESGSAWAGLGEVLLAGERFEEAVVAFKRAIEIEPTSPFALTGYVYACENAGSLMDAQAVLVSATKIDPNNCTLWHLLAGFESARNDQERAIEAYKRVLEIDPDDAVAHSGIARSLMILDENLEEAKKHLMESVRLDPEWHYPYVQLGEIAIREKDFESAARWFIRAKELGVDDQELLEYLSDPTIERIMAREK